MSARPVRLIAGFATVGGWTMASRILGFVRDVAIAAVLGAGAVAEAFFVAFTLPNLFRRFFAEGAFNTAFVPLFAKRIEAARGSGDLTQAKTFAEDALALLVTVLLAVTLLAQLAMPWLVLGLASGLDATRFELATAFGRLVFPYILLISVAALFSGVLNALDRFAAAAAAPVLLNVILITMIGLAGTGWLAETLTLTGLDGVEGLHAGTMLCLGVILAGIAQAWLVWRAATRAGIRLRLRLPRLTPEMKRLAVIAAPAALAGGVMQINLVVGRQVASYYEGAVGWLWYADRVYQLPLGVIGVAIGVVLLPSLSRRVRAGDPAGVHDALNRAAEFALTLTLPATAALIAMPGLIVAVLFERGAFGAADAAATALALAIYAAGLPAFVLQKVLQPAFFSREDTATPLRYALWCMLANVVIAVGGAALFGWLAAAAGATVAGWLNLWLLWRGARAADPGLTVDARLARRLPRILAATLIMTALVVGLTTLTAVDPLGGVLALTAAVIGGLVVYGAAGLALGAFAISDLRGAMRRGSA